MSVFKPGQRVCAILNVHSGWDDGSACSHQIEREMKAVGVELTVENVKKGSDITALARGAVEQGCSAVIAGGGDGTLNAVAQGLLDTGVPMGIVPIGTLNHLARDLRVPLDPDAAIRSLTTSRAFRIDVGEVNGSVFLNNSIIGLYPAYWFARERHEKRGRPKWLSIFSALLSVFRRLPSMTVRLLLDGAEVVRRTPYILLANNEHRMEGYELGNRERLDSGHLWVYLMRPMTRWGLVRLAFSLLFGRFRKQQGFESFQARSVRIETRRRRVGVALDGDVRRIASPLEYRSRPGALTVLAPPEAAEKTDAEKTDNDVSAVHEPARL